LNNIILQSAAVDKESRRFADKKSKCLNKKSSPAAKAVCGVEK